MEVLRFDLSKVSSMTHDAYIYVVSFSHSYQENICRKDENFLQLLRITSVDHTVPRGRLSVPFDKFV